MKTCVDTNKSGKTALATALKDRVKVFDTPPLVDIKAVVGGEDDEDEEDEDEEDGEDEDGILFKHYWMIARNSGNVQRYKDPFALAEALVARVAFRDDLVLAYGTPVFGSYVPDTTPLDDLDPEEAADELRRRAAEKRAADTEQFLTGLARAAGRLKRVRIC